MPWEKNKKKQNKTNLAVSLLGISLLADLTHGGKATLCTCGSPFLPIATISIVIKLALQYSLNC